MAQNDPEQFDALVGQLSCRAGLEKNNLKQNKQTNIKQNKAKQQNNKTKQSKKQTIIQSKNHAHTHTHTNKHRCIHAPRRLHEIIRRHFNSE